MKTVKTDLHMHPHFYDLRSGVRVPSLLEIAQYLFDKGIGICALSSCQPKPGVVDRRFEDYMAQREKLEKHFTTDYDGKQGILYVFRPREGGQEGDR